MRAEDTVVVSSDHGFVELVDEDAAPVADSDRWERYVSGGAHPVNYRYASTHDLPEDLEDVYRVSYPRCHDRYTVAIGRRWFKREGWHGQSDRYAHGGLSLAEMVVPGARLKRIVEPRLQVSLTMEPESLDLEENAEGALAIHVSNQGNVSLSASLEVQANTASEAASYAVELKPGERQGFPYAFQAVYRQGSGEKTERVDVSLHYQDLDGAPRDIRRRVPVVVKPRTDIVEIDFGGLDDLNI